MEEKNIAQRLGEKIRDLRTAAKMSQQELADKASSLLPGDQYIYRTDLSNFEKRGESITSIVKIDALLSVFDQKLTLEKKTLSMLAPPAPQNRSSSFMFSPQLRDAPTARPDLS